MDNDQQKQSTSDLLSSFSHEIRSPLAAICGGVELLSSGRCDSSQQPEIMAMLLRQAIEMSGSIDILHDFSRFQRGCLKMVKTPVPLSAILSDSFSEQRGVDASHPSDVLAAGSCSPLANGLVLADQARITAAIRRTLQRLPHAIASVAMQQRRGALTLTITCTADSAALRPSVGLDLATEMDQHILKQHDIVFHFDRDRRVAEIEVPLLEQESACVADPIVCEFPPQSESTQQLTSHDRECRDPIAIRAAQNRSSTLDVLAVDDSPALAMMLGRMVQSIGHRCVTAYSVSEAWKSIDGRLPDVILTDLRMPGIDGFEFAKQLAQNEQTSEIPVVAITGEADAVADGQDDFCDVLVKPLSTKQLRRTLAQAELAMTR